MNYLLPSPSSGLNGRFQECGFFITLSLKWGAGVARTVDLTRLSYCNAGFFVGTSVSAALGFGDRSHIASRQSISIF